MFLNSFRLGFSSIFLLFLVNARSEDKFSFTLVIDNTSSMGKEIGGVKIAANLIFDAVLKTGSALIENYVLVTINDPYVKLETVTKDPNEFKRQLHSIRLININNRDCPEMALTGVELAMENSLPHSLVYVFTDADAKDAGLLDRVRNLAFRKQIQLVFILTNSCRRGNYDPTYATLAKATNGLVFTGSKTEVEKILKFAEEAVKTRRTVIGKGVFPPGAHNMNVSIDPTMNDMIFTSVGKDVKSKVYNPDGTLANTESVIDTSHAKAVKVNITEPGNYGLHFESNSNTSILVQASTDLDFYHGFSLTKPSSIVGTSILPLPDVESHLAINVICNKDVVLETVELHDLSENLIMEIPLEKSRKKFYVTEGFKPPNSFFYITIKGFLPESNSTIERTSSTPVEPQNIKLVKTEDKSPTISIDRAYVEAEYEQPLIIACNVQAYPKPTIIWYDEEGKEIENKVINYDVPYGYRNELVIGGVNKNTTYSCKAINFLGESISKVKVETKRKNYFYVILRPTDMTIEYKKSGNVICSIDSNPPSTITWQNNNKELIANDEIEISSDRTKLHIKEMKPEFNGSYSCQVDNGLNSTAFNFNVLINGVAPTVNVDTAKMSLEYNEPINIDCSVNGFPEPKIFWKDLDTGAALPSFTRKSHDVKYDYMSTLKIDQSKKNATYQCFASNDKGEGSKNVEVETRVHLNVLKEPKDLNIEFKKSSTVECKVDANPSANITWHRNKAEISNDSFDIIYSKDGKSILSIKEMEPFLEGNYTCRAANDFQTEELNFNIFITGTAPKTSINESPKIKADYDTPLQILCKVSGYPEPEISWHNKDSGEEIFSHVGIANGIWVANGTDTHFEAYLGADYPSPVGESYDYGKIMRIDAVNKNATYTCRAKNTLGVHSTDVQVETVKKTYFDIVVAPKDTNIEFKKSAKIKCVVDSFPLSTITWYKGDKEITVDSDIEITENGTVLDIKRMTVKLNGTYCCKAQNSHNSSALYFNIIIIGIAPVVSIEGGLKQIAEYNAPINLECHITGFPALRTIWKERDSTNILPSATMSSVDKQYDFVSILHIDHSEKNTTYQCFASNDKGEDTKSVEVKTRVYIDIVKRPKDLNVEFKKNGRVSCKVDANPPAIITWHKDGMKIRSDDNLDVAYGSDGSSILTISNMKPHIAGKYSCNAVNDFLLEEMNFNIVITGTAAKTSIEEAPKINAEYDKPLSILCRVSGYPEPKIVWLNKDTGKELHDSLAPVNLPYDHGKLLHIDRVNKNETFTCKAKNSLGEHSSDVQVETMRKTFFDVLEKPKDTTIKYKENEQVLCNVSANPPAVIDWYKNGKEIQNNSHIFISANRTVLSVTNMQPDTKGSYICRASNKNNNSIFEFNIFITGIILPKINKSSQLVTVLEGSKAVIECRLLRGDPVPAISWRFRAASESRYKNLKENGTEIIIDNATRDRAGVYRCTATNAGGSDRLSIDFTIEYAPTIKIRNKKSVTLQEGETKTLYCDTSGIPKPTVTWLLNDVPVDTSQYEIFSDHSIKIEASVHVVGELTCLAENKHGQAKETTKIDFTAPVEIDPPSESKIEVLEGDEVEMSCEADGYPRPKIQWTFFSHNASSPKLLKDAESPDTLVIRSAELERSGYYVCSARNDKSAVNMTYEVIVNAPPKIIQEKPTTTTTSTNTFTAVKGDFVLRIPCKVTGWPKPEIRWIRNGHFLASGTKWYDIADDRALVIKNIDEGGSYFCNATNKYGSDEKLFKVQLEDFPTPPPPLSTVPLYIGDTAHIDCDLPHQRVDQLRWYKDGKLLVDGELTLNSVQGSDSGLYVCRVSTLSGSESSTISVVVIYYR